ncbi:MarR family transcriptional regulator [Gordonia polyisoprenivorans]|uniref:MarR family winged helix-turn-helix transcriptional regulator n=1 Tax=Gordonia polyisoprenivorans TaxID=84595 RepID=UPI0003713AC9|nr:MarR family transcriptional regulator [Gordonia polyisoprenivorans]OZC31441.1 MarR family transcriptional regulator [Gordonia polyisoprenivorans]QUD84181.1 MarR family transcriptional regulator [Gordonia polyisoprenivorans]
MSPTAPDTTTIVETTVEPDTPATATSATDTPATGTSDVAVLYHHLVRITRSLRSGGQGVLSAGVASALWTIINHGPLRLSELADRESVTMPTMSRIVASLEQQGFVERAPDPDDGRARQLVATVAGTEHINHARSAKAQILGTAMERLDPQTRSHLTEGVVALAAALSDTALSDTALSDTALSGDELADSAEHSVPPR